MTTTVNTNDISAMSLNDRPKGHKKNASTVLRNHTPLYGAPVEQAAQNTLSTVIMQVVQDKAASIPAVATPEQTTVKDVNAIVVFSNGAADSVGGIEGGVELEN